MMCEYKGFHYPVPGECPNCGKHASDDVVRSVESTPYGDERLTVTYKCRLCGCMFEKIFYKK